MCCNRFSSDDDFAVTLTHELIHAYDLCRAEVDFHNPIHHACTEIRAANLSGNCTFMRELRNTRQFNITNHHNVNNHKTQKITKSNINIGIVILLNLCLYCICVMCFVCCL